MRKLATRVTHTKKGHGNWPQKMLMIGEEGVQGPHCYGWLVNDAQGGLDIVAFAAELCLFE